MKKISLVAGFMVDGNGLGSEEPRVYIQGSTRNATFLMDQSGDASVGLPLDAISSTEMFNEPGTASVSGGTLAITMDGTLQILLSRSITVPASGVFW